MARPALVLAVLGAVGVGTTLGAPTALAGTAGLAPRVAQTVGVAQAVPPAAPSHQAPAFGARPTTPSAAPAVTGPAPAVAAPVRTAPAPAPVAAPALSPAATGPAAAAVPVSGADPNVRVVLAPDARGPLPPAVTVPASQVPANAVAPALASGTTGPAGGTLSLASVSGPTGSAGRVEAGPAAGLRVASLAQTQLGAHYVWGGSSPASGFDCSGFVYWAFGQAGHPISRVMTEQFASGRRVRLEELQPGDVVFYQNTYTAGLSHDGIYVGDDKFIHAADESSSVALTPLHSAYWEQHFAGAVRIME